MTKISVITICYNAENVIEKTMISVLNQTYDNIEYIIVDGVSKDNTVAIAHKISLQYPHRNIRIYSEPDRGIYDAMNKGVKLATGEWLNMMNAGDCFHSDTVIRDVFNSDISESIDLIYSDSFLVRSSCQKTLVNHDLQNPPYGFCHQAMFYRKKLHDEHGLYVFTQKLIIADTLFLIRIPVESMYKTDVIIADFAAGGASGIDGYNMQKQNLCAQFIFKDKSFISVFMDYYLLRLRHALIPNKLRQLYRQKKGKIKIQ